jgi:hypothetical protein
LNQLKIDKQRIYERAVKLQKARLKGVNMISFMKEEIAGKSLSELIDHPITGGLIKGLAININNRVSSSSTANLVPAS